jgi:hypothetical protein
MGFRFRVLGAFIVACGLALCYGAMALWPSGPLEMPLASGAAARGALHIAVAVVAAIFGVGNLLAGLVVVLRPPTRD